MTDSNPIQDCRFLLEEIKDRIVACDDNLANGILCAATVHGCSLIEAVNTLLAKKSLLSPATIISRSLYELGVRVLWAELTQVGYERLCKSWQEEVDKFNRSAAHAVPNKYTSAISNKICGDDLDLESLKRAPSTFQMLTDIYSKFKSYDHEFVDNVDQSVEYQYNFLYRHTTAHVHGQLNALFPKEEDLTELSKAVQLIAVAATGHLISACRHHLDNDPVKGLWKANDRVVELMTACRGLTYTHTDV